MDANIVCTHRCTLACPRCNVIGAKHWVANLELKRFRDFLFAARDLGRYYDRMFFTGGEPTLWMPLREAIQSARDSGIVGKTIVVSNGWERNIWDYGSADRIYLSDYGAQNRLDLLRLKQQGGRRVVIGHPVHVDRPISSVPDTLPAQCNCFGDTLMDDRVYPCYESGLARRSVSTGLNEDWVAIFKRDWSFTERTCMTCLANGKVMETLRTPLVAEFLVWSSQIGCMIAPGGKGKWIRRIWRRIKAGDYEKAAMTRAAYDRLAAQYPPKG